MINVEQLNNSSQGSHFSLVTNSFNGYQPAEYFQELQQKSILNHISIKSVVPDKSFSVDDSKNGINLLNIEPNGRKPCDGASSQSREKNFDWKLRNAHLKRKKRKHKNWTQPTKKSKKRLAIKKLQNSIDFYAVKNAQLFSSKDKIQRWQNILQKSVFPIDNSISGDDVAFLRLFLTNRVNANAVNGNFH